MPEIDFVVKEETGIRVSLSTRDVVELVDELELYPEEVFKEDVLTEWAKENGFTRSE